MNVLLVSVKNTFMNLSNYEYDLYRAATACWYIQGRGNYDAQQMLDISYVVAFFNGEVVGVLEPTEWFRVDDRAPDQLNLRNRWCFKGEVISKGNPLVSQVVNHDLLNKSNGAAAFVENVNFFTDLVI